VIGKPVNVFARDAGIPERARVRPAKFKMLAKPAQAGEIFRKKIQGGDVF